VPSPAATQQATCQRRCSDLEQLGPIPLIADPFVRYAFERAEREDGTAPTTTAVEPAAPRWRRDSDRTLVAVMFQREPP
jgi:hypothetical protein